MTNDSVPPLRRRIALIGLFLSAICTMADFVITPIVSNIFETFSESPAALVSFGITGPALVGTPFLILSGWLCDRFDKKKVMIYGFAVFTFAAVFGAVFENVWYWLICRLVVGVGWGFTSTTAFSIIADLYPDENRRARIVGWYNASLSAIGAVLSVCAGYLASSGWQNVYKLYWAAIPILILLFLLPSCPPSEETGKADSENARGSAAVSPTRWKGALGFLCVEILLVGICYYEAVYMPSLYVVSAGIGGEAETGQLVSMLTVSGAIGAICFGWLFSKLGEKVYIPFLLLIGAGFIAMTIWPNYAVAAVSMVVMGFSWQTFYCYFYTKAGSLAPESERGLALGFVGFMNSLAAAGSSYLLLGAMEAAVTGSAVDVWHLFGVGVIAVALVVIASGVAKRVGPNASEEAPSQSGRR